MSLLNNKYHQHLAEYFKSKPLYMDEPARKKPGIRKLVEQPLQETKAGLRENVTDTLCDLIFFEAKAKADLLSELQEDYHLAVKTFGQEGYIADFYNALMLEQHNIRSFPQYTFQQIYNILQWKEGYIFDKVDRAREMFLKGGGCFLWQYREPGIVKNRILMTLAGHSHTISSCSFSPDGAKIVSGSFDKTLKLWDASTGLELATLAGNDESVECCSFSPDGKIIVSGAGSVVSHGELKLWDTETGIETSKVNRTFHRSRMLLLFT